MKTIRNHGDTIWIDLESPSVDEVRGAAETAGLSPEIVEGLLSPSLRHKAEFGKEHAYIVMHFPAFGQSKTDDAGFEVDFLMTKGVVITAHYERVEPLEEFVPSDKNLNGVFFGLLGELLTNFERKLSSVDHWVRDVEKKMFSGQEKETIFELSEASRHLIDFRKITAIYPEVLASLSTDGGEIFGKKFSEHADEMLQRFEKSKNKLDVLFETVHELRETNNALLSTKQNESMRMLTKVTIFATILVGIALVWVGLLAIK
jgi:magnesium transporter